MWTRELLKRNAKEIFKRNYWTCVGVSLVLAALTGGGSSVIGRIGGNNTSVSYHHYGSDYYYGDSARGFMISMVVVAVTLIVVLAAVAFTIFAGNVFKIGGCSFFIKNRTMTGTFGNLLDGFKSGHYGNVVKTMFLIEGLLFQSVFHMFCIGWFHIYWLKIRAWILNRYLKSASE